MTLTLRRLLALTLLAPLTILLSLAMCAAFVLACLLALVSDNGEA